MSTKVKSRDVVPLGVTPKRNPERGGADPRRAAMLSAAFEAFVEHGVSGATTEEIARRARVSKREIYRIFGSKEALFAEIVRERGRSMQQGLELAAAASVETALDTIERFGREFLGLLTEPSTIAVYRMAIAESTRLPELGRQLDVQGRETVREALHHWLVDARRRAVLPVSDPERAADSLLATLQGDLPLRLMLGTIQAPDAASIASRAAAARAAFQRLWLHRK
jgi:AcrR family transcriptional regulator